MALHENKSYCNFIIIPGKSTIMLKIVIHIARSGATLLFLIDPPTQNQSHIKRNRCTITNYVVDLRKNIIFLELGWTKLSNQSDRIEQNQIEPFFLN